MTAANTSMTLLARARRRDASAWERLVHLYSPLVRHWLRSRVAASEVDDLSQEVFAAVAKNLDGFRRDRPGDSFRGWLRGIAQRKVASHYRSRGVAATGGTDAQIRMDEVAEPDWPDDDADAIHSLYQRALELVRSEFEANTWKMFWRTTIDARPAVDVAREMEVNPAAVRMAKSRVLRRLREEVGDVLEE